MDAIRLIFALVLMLALVSCGESQTATDSDGVVAGSTSIKRYVRNNYAQARIMGLSEVMKVGTMRCKRVRIAGRNAFGGSVINEVIVILNGASVSQWMTSDEFVTMTDAEMRRLTKEARARLLPQREGVLMAQLYALE